MNSQLLKIFFSNLSSSEAQNFFYIIIIDLKNFKKGLIYFFPDSFFHIYTHVITILLYVAEDFSPSRALTLVLSKGM